MRAAPVCPRCGRDVHAPGVWSSAWTCDAHGTIDPLYAAVRPSAEVTFDLAHRASVPLWLAWPLPEGWLLTGVREAGDDRTGTRAIATACSGPAPLGGIGELVLVSELPGIGLGAGLAGLDGVDPGGHFVDRAPDAKVVADGHPTPLWSVPAPGDRAVFVGEALGHWLWAILWPAAAGYLVAERLQLVDLRDIDIDHDPGLPFGAMSPRLVHSPLR